MSLINQIKEHRTQAMKDKDKFRLSVLRLLLSELDKERVEIKLEKVEDLSDNAVETVIGRQIKKLDKEKEAYVQAKADTSSQDKEKELLLMYLPKQMTEQEAHAFVSSYVAGMKESGMNFGQIMKGLGIELRGRADMAKISKLAKELF